MQNGNQASAHLENEEEGSCGTIPGIKRTYAANMSLPTENDGVAPGPAAGVSQPLERGVREMMDILLNGSVVGAVEVTRNTRTQKVETVLGWELVAALCDLSKEKARSALNHTLDANPSLRQVSILF